MGWSKHPRASYYLGTMSFAESVIFPIPVDVMLAPMCLSRLDKAWHYAFIATVTSAWVVFLAAFAPIPYKLVTISAGIIPISLYEFTLASIVGRAGRFYLVAGLIVLGGEKMEKKLHQIIDYLGWAVVILSVLAYFIYKYY